MTERRGGQPSEATIGRERSPPRHYNVHLDSGQASRTPSPARKYVLPPPPRCRRCCRYRCCFCCGCSCCGFLRPECSHESEAEHAAEAARMHKQQQREAMQVRGAAGAAAAAAGAAATAAAAATADPAHSFCFSFSGRR